MNGEDLVYDWIHNVVGEPSEWAYNWDYGECGTPHPRAMQNHATMWAVVNNHDPRMTLKVLFTKICKKSKNLKYREIPPKASSDDYDKRYKFEITNKRTKDSVVEGFMDDPHGEGFSPDPNVGIFATFHATTAEGRELMKKLVETKDGSVVTGMLCYVPQDRVETHIGYGYRVVSVTGFGSTDDSKDGLATRFTLFHEDEEVARCLMTYEDGSFDSSMGPTLEMLAVKQSRRGEGLAKVLWYYVRRFIECNFTIECLNNDAPPKHTMVKATQITNAEVEIRQEKDGTRHSMGFKEFLYDYCGFSVREQKGAVAFMLGGRRIKDEEAVLYIPLLPRGAPSPKKAPKPGKAIYREEIGARMCQWCSEVSIDKLRCKRCGVAFYCNTSCQRNDWKRHKLWCNKPREKVREALIKRGHMTIDEKGNASLIMNGPNRTFG